MTTPTALNNYYSREELDQFGFKSLGRDVFISRKAGIYSAADMSFGDNVRIDDNTVLAGKIEFKSHIHIAAMTYISGGDVGVLFENFTAVAPHCYITTGSDDYTGRSLFSGVIPAKYKIEHIDSIIIRRFSIVGTHSFIMPGVELAEGTSVGAMTFMTKSSKPWTTYFGIPAYAIGEKERNIIEMSEKFLEEYALRERERERERERHRRIGYKDLFARGVVTTNYPYYQIYLKGGSL
jgi:acetyltransferase-like isoleucine patch superfamily enzyme